MLTKKPISPSSSAPGPPGDRRPHHHVLLAGAAGEQRLEAGQQDHERGGALAACQRPQLPHQLRAEEQGDRCRGAAPRDRARPVRGQLQQGRGAVQPLPPPGEPALQPLPRQLGALPDGVVGVLDGERGERGLPAARERPVRGSQLPQQHPHGPAVRRDVVEDQEEQVVVAREAEEQGPEDRPARQVEGAGSLRVRGPRRRGLALRGGKGAQVRQGDRERGGPGHRLHRVAVHQREDGAQRLVPVDQGLQAPPQRPGVERAAQAQRVRHVVGGAAGIELVEEPEPPLGEGEGKGPSPGSRGMGAAPSPAPSRAASSAGVGASNTWRSGSSAPVASRSRAATRAASSECPPRAKKSSCDPDPLHPQHLGERGGHALLGAGCGAARARRRPPGRVHGIGAGRGGPACRAG